MSTTRGYLNDAQYQAITGGASLGGDADKIISRAEAIIDGLIGNWQPYIGHIKGVAQSGTETTVQMSAADSASLPGVNYLKGCVIEILTGDAEGEYRTIKAQDALGGLTVDTAFSAPIGATDVYHIWQMGKVPRRGTGDISNLLDGGVQVYVKTVPSAVREAVAYQVKYMQELGADYFDGNGINMDSESFGKYSYTKSDSAKGDAAIIAPRARTALKGTGIINRSAQITGY